MEPVQITQYQFHQSIEMHTCVCWAPSGNTQINFLSLQTIPPKNSSIVVNRCLFLFLGLIMEMSEKADVRGCCNTKHAVCSPHTHTHPHGVWLKNPKGLCCNGEINARGVKKKQYMNEASRQGKLISLICTKVLLLFSCHSFSLRDRCRGQKATSKRKTNAACAACICCSPELQHGCRVQWQLGGKARSLWPPHWWIIFPNWTGG